MQPLESDNASTARARCRRGLVADRARGWKARGVLGFLVCLVRQSAPRYPPSWHSLEGWAKVSIRRQERPSGGLPSKTSGRSAAGSASPCQGEGRGFESRRPLGDATRARRGQPRWSGREARQRPAKPCTRVQIPSPPRQQRGRLAQWERASLTRKRSLVQTQYRPPYIEPGEGPDSDAFRPGLFSCTSRS
jgi:hypothetical protein